MDDCLPLNSRKLFLGFFVLNQQCWLLNSAPKGCYSFTAAQYSVIDINLTALLHTRSKVGSSILASAVCWSVLSIWTTVYFSEGLLTHTMWQSVWKIIINVLVQASFVALTNMQRQKKIPVGSKYVKFGAYPIKTNQRVKFVLVFLLLFTVSLNVGPEFFLKQTICMDNVCELLWVI